jgi:hypothetical protein|tara:strand:+ start:44 stop:382 length:339 start_codon:yes stop_codon:yes gene_type:complete
MIQKFNQVGVACVCADSMNTAIRQTLNISKDTMINIPEKWFETNRECAKLLPWWGDKADYSNYDAKAHYDSLVILRQVSADIVEEIAGKEAVDIYWAETERRTNKKIWIEYK